MLYNEVIEKFLVEYDRVYSLTTKGYEPDEILNFVNQAMDAVVDELFASKNLQYLSTITAPIALTSEIANSPSTLFTADLTSLNNDRRHYLRSECYIERSYSPVFKGIIPTILTSMEAVRKLAQTSPINNTFFFNPRVAFDNVESMILVVDKTVTLVNDFKYTYIKRPNRLVTTITGQYQSTVLDINKNLYDTVISKAAQLAKVVNDPARIEYIQGGKQ